MSLTALTICTNGESGSHEFKQCGARITQVYDTHTGTWSGFEISVTEHAKDISIITLPSHRRRDRKSQITPLEVSHLRPLNVSCFGWVSDARHSLLAPLSLLMGQTPQATVDTIYEVNKLARKATAWARTLKVHAHHPPVVVTYTDAGWTTRQTALHKADSWSSLQTPSCRKAKNQTCL